MDVELNLISKVIKEQDLTPALDGKITPSFFEDDEHRRVWEHIHDHWLRYGSLPTAKTLRHEFPEYQLVKTDEPTDYYIDQLREKRKFGLVQIGLQDALTKFNDGFTDESVRAMSALVTEVNTQITVLKDTDLTKTTPDRILRYKVWAEQGGKGLRGIATGYTIIDRATSGLQREQLVTLVGLPKASKSTQMMRMAININRLGKPVMFVSFEMSNEEQEVRHDSLRAEISYNRLLHGRATEEDFARLERMDKLLKGCPPMIFSADISAATTLSALRAKVQEYQPDVLFIDGVYLMMNEGGHEDGTPQALTWLTRNLKRMAQSLRIPIVVSTQGLYSRYNKRKGIAADTIGYTSSFAQDSDVILGVERMDDEGLAKISIVESRNSPRCHGFVRVDWERGTIEEVEFEDSDDNEVLVGAAEY